MVAVSGGIGSGKSSVTASFKSLGALVADADVIAREILEPGRPALAQVAARFGDDLIREDGTLAEVAARFGADLIRPDGTLDRAGLARRVFAGEGADERVAALNAITHPAIERRAWEILNAAPAGSLAVYDIPLLVEGDYADRFDAVVIVDAPVEERVARLEGRGVAPERSRTCGSITAEARTIWRRCARRCGSVG